MTDPTIDKAALEAAAATPMRDLISSIAAELELGWRARSYPMDGMASHQWGDDASAEVGRILRAHLAALPPTTDGVRVTVRELEWEEVTSPREDGPPEPTGDWNGFGVTGAYCVYFFEDHFEVTRPGGEYVESHLGDAEEAKAAAQSDYTARIMASLNISEVEPVAWVVLLNYGEGRWSGEMLTDVLPKDSTQYKIVRPLYASPTTSPHAPEGVRDAVLEEAAKVADKVAAEDGAHWKSAGRDEEAKSHYLWSMQTGEQIAAAIRALKGNRT